MKAPIKDNCTRCNGPLYPGDSAWIDEGMNLFCNTCATQLLLDKCNGCFYDGGEGYCTIEDEGNCICKAAYKHLDRVWVAD